MTDKVISLYTSPGESSFRTDYSLTSVPTDADSDIENFSFTCMQTRYHVCQNSNGSFELIRFVQSLSDNGFQGFQSLQSAVQFADVWERLIHFAMLGDESKQFAIDNFTSAINDLNNMTVLPSTDLQDN